MSKPAASYRSGPVLVIGAAGVDIVGIPKGELSPGTSSPARIRTSFGGVARNVAENLARLGQPAILVTVVGNDAVGEQLLSLTAAAGVDVGATLHSEEHPTGSYLAVVNSSGELQFALDDMRALAALTPDAVRDRESLFTQASLLFVDANLPRDTLRTVMSLARRENLPVCADPTSSSLALRLKPFLPRMHLLIPNSAEAGILCGQAFHESKTRQAVEAAKCLVNQGVDIAVVTLAQFGVCYATSSTSGYLPAIRTQIVDPTGAGDALTGALLFGLLNDIALDDAMRLGLAAASLTLRHRGAVAADLSLERLYEHLVI